MLDGYDPVMEKVGITHEQWLRLKEYINSQVDEIREFNKQLKEELTPKIFNNYPLPWSVSKWEGDVILDKNGSLVIGYGEVGNDELFKAIVEAVNITYYLFDEKE